MFNIPTEVLIGAVIICVALVWLGVWGAISTGAKYEESMRRKEFDKKRHQRLEKLLSHHNDCTYE